MESSHFFNKHVKEISSTFSQKKKFSFVTFKLECIFIIFMHEVIFESYLSAEFFISFLNVIESADLTKFYKHF
jgi:hypothetical protein